MRQAVRTVNMTAVNEWMALHQPRAVEKLAAAADISIRTVDKLLRGEALMQSGPRHRTATVLGLSVDELFPIRVDRKQTA